MMTLRQLASPPDALPVATAWYLADLGEARGKSEGSWRQELFARQAPQKLKALREHALIESAVSSNRIEGVEVDRSRVATIMFGRPLLRDRDEQELRGYRDALNLIHEKPSKFRLNEATIRRLHRLSRGGVGDAGEYRVRESDIIQRYPDGRQRVRFKTAEARKVPDAMRELVELWPRLRRERWVPPLIGLAAFNLDFLCIHPFRDGNGRVSRLLLLLQCYQLGYEVGRYVSLERLIEENKERYYEALEQSSQRWHDGKHDPWPYVNFLLYILKLAYREFEERIGQTVSPKGAKTELIIGSIGRFDSAFRVSDLRQDCPGVSLDMIRRVLKDLQRSGKVECLSRGQSAEWKRTKRWK